MNMALGCLKLFFRKAGLLPRIYHMLNRINPTFDSLHPVNLQAITRAMQQSPHGDYYEFGVYKGFSLWFATQIADALGLSEMRFFGFDSFDGLPEPKGLDREPDAAGNTFARGNFCAGLDLVRGFLAKHGADMTKVRLIPGFFEDVLDRGLVAKEGMHPAAVVLIDCDMYESTRTVLNFLPCLLQRGTIVLFDDWLLTDENKGQQLAFRQWSESNKEFQMVDFCEFAGGKGFRVTNCPESEPRRTTESSATSETSGVNAGVRGQVPSTT